MKKVSPLNRVECSLVNNHINKIILNRGTRQSRVSRKTSDNSGWGRGVWTFFLRDIFVFVMLRKFDLHTLNFPFPVQFWWFTLFSSFDRDFIHCLRSFDLVTQFFPIYIHSVLNTELLLVVIYIYLNLFSLSSSYSFCKHWLSYVGETGVLTWHRRVLFLHRY